MASELVYSWPASKLPHAQTVAHLLTAQVTR